jgi:hypothetical protein
MVLGYRVPTLHCTLTRSPFQTFLYTLCKLAPSVTKNIWQKLVAFSNIGHCAEPPSFLMTVIKNKTILEHFYQAEFS